MGGSSSRVEPSRIVTQQLLSEHSLQRLALDPSGALGSLYDATRDHLLPCAPLYMSRRFIALRQEMPPIVVTSGRFKAKDFLDTIGVDKELYLSLALNLTTPKETSFLHNYPFPTNEYTRYFFFHHKTKHSYFSPNELLDQSKENPSLLAANTNATHVITEIQYGIHIVLIMQLAPENTTALDELLERVEQQLIRKTFTINAREKRLCEGLTDIKVFSNIAEIASLTTFVGICEKIIQIRSNTFSYPPMKYTLRSLRLLCPWLPHAKGTSVPLNASLANQIELHLYELFSVHKRLQASVSPPVEQAVLNYFKQPYEDLQRRATKVEELYPRRLQRLRNLILAIRGGNVRANELKEPAIDKEDTGLLKECRAIIEQREMFAEKVQFVDELKQRNIEYWNVKEFVSKDDEDIEVIEEELMNRRKGKRIFCYDDTLKRQWFSEWKTRHEELLNGEKTSNLVYADFSFCVTRPSEMIIISYGEFVGPRRSTWDESTGHGRASARKKLRLDLNVPSSNTFINILLLGEIGVGKSTFINALLNYLKYETLDRACSDKPLAAIPVSFPLAVGDHFDENVIQLGGTDPNEDHRYSGQSVTQQCRSYVLPISSQVNIRLIDTPGMGDKRGFGQDDLVMQNILSFVNNLPHINAICILLKPSESRVNILFRSYFTRLLAFFGEHIRNNIVFCFTHTRATFFAPGNTAALLRKMLHANSMKNVPLKKTNTFCFDSEGFRYLIARQNGLQFDNYQKDEYRKSWETSVKETTHLLYFVCKDLKPSEQKTWQSIEHAQWQINKLVRPALETIANQIRNMVLLNNAASSTFIQLSPSSVQRNFLLCAQCERAPILLGNFWIIPDDLHLFSSQCNKCQCTFVQHTKVNYVLKYELYNEKRNLSVSDMKGNLDLLKHWTIGLLDFFRYIGRISKEKDPILLNLQRMTEEEKNIVMRAEQNSPNQYLYEELKAFKQEYERLWTVARSARKAANLSDVYKLIRNLGKDSTIGAQLEAIKQTQQTYMNEQEKRWT